MIYYVEAVGRGLVKIGFTDIDPTKRLTSLQTGSPDRLTLRAVFVGDRTDEQQHHETWAANRAHGEWFTVCAEMKQFLALASVCHVAGRAPARLDVEAVGWINVLIAAVTKLRDRVDQLEGKSAGLPCTCGDPGGRELDAMFDGGAADAAELRSDSPVALARR